MSNPTAFDIKEAWKQAKQSLGTMNSTERKQTLINSGILTKSGNVAKAYSKVIKAAK
jgi:hypothetical protein